MPIARITGQGLAAIALSVSLLWTCLIAERVTLHHAAARQAQLMRELHQLQINHRAQPVSAPAQESPRSVRITLG